MELMNKSETQEKMMEKVIELLGEKGIDPMTEEWTVVQPVSNGSVLLIESIKIGESFIVNERTFKKVLFFQRLLVKLFPTRVRRILKMLSY